MLYCLLFLLKHQCFSQYAIASSPGQVYSDITPDTCLSPYMNFSSQSYSIDMNQDGTDDVKITTMVQGSPGATITNVSVVSLNNSLRFVLGSVDSTYSSMGYWNTRKILKKYSASDTISSSSFILTNSGYIGYYYASGGIIASSTQWQNAGDKYIGVVHMDTTQTLYGWILVRVVNSSTCYIKEFSLGTPTIGLVKFNNPENELLLSPQPASDIMYIQSTQMHFTGKPI